MSVITFFCPNCWMEVEESDKICPRCGTNIEKWRARHDYSERLIAALRHPEPSTPVRVAWVLGERKEERAVEPLTEVIEKTGDAFGAEAAVEALGKIGGARAEEAVRRATGHTSLRVRAKACETLRRFRPAAKGIDKEVAR